jgi:hypothetical protein
MPQREYCRLCRHPLDVPEWGGRGFCMICEAHITHLYNVSRPYCVRGPVFDQEVYAAVCRMRHTIELEAHPETTGRATYALVKLMQRVAPNGKH